MLEGMMHGPIKIAISDSVFRGQADGFRLSEAHEVNLEITHTAWAISGSILAIDTKNSVQLATSTKPPPCQIRLDHITAVTEGGLISVEAGEAGVATTIDIRCDNSIISLLRTDRAMISMKGPVDMEEWLKQLSWTGTSNYMDVPCPLWEISAVRSINSPNRKFNPADWNRHWKSSGDTPIDRNVFESADAWDSPNFHLVNAQAFALYSPPNAAYKAPEAQDGTNAGVDWKRPRVPKRLPTAEVGK